MKNLATFVDRANFFDEFKGRPLTYDLKNMDEKKCQQLFDEVDNALSPENLTCDGELRGADLRDKARYLSAVVNELNEYANVHGFNIVDNEWRV